MITNERQYRISRAHLDNFKKTIESFDMEGTIKAAYSKQLAQAHLDALRSEFEVLRVQIEEYETLKTGKIKIFTAANLEELPLILIRARIAKGLSQKELAELMGLKEQQIQRYEAEEYATANLKRLSEVAEALAINIKEVAALKDIEGDSATDNGFEWDEFPVKEMYRKGWFNFTGSLSEAMANAQELVKDFIGNTLSEPMAAAARQRVRMGGNVSKYALIAWQVQVLKIAKSIELEKKFNRTTLSDEWFRKLAKLSSDKNGISKAVKYLKEAGIRLIVLPHLSNTHLDGAAFLISDGPVIGMTLRYDRLDNFWFVLFHELIHIKKHLHKGDIESIFDDLEESPDEIEKEADEGAGEILVPSEKWESALVRYVRTKDAIEDFAQEIGVGVAIVAGKIRREAGNYIIFNDIVGQGEVRNQFNDVDFSC